MNHGVAETLARHGGFSIESCPCGCVRLHAGPVTLRLDREHLGVLAAVLTEASWKLAAREGRAAEGTG